MPEQKESNYWSKWYVIVTVLLLLEIVIFIVLTHKYA